MREDLRFVLACCRAEPSHADVAFMLSFVQNQTFNIQELLSLSARHGVLPLVYKTLKPLHSSPLTSHSSLKQFLNELKANYQNIARRNMLMSAELLHIMKLLQENGIEALAFKGPVLSQMAYGDITLRQYGDLDILIKREDFRKIAKLMRDRGYTPFFPIETFAEDKVLFELNNDCPFYDRTRGLAVELHWNFFRKLALPTEKFFPWKDQTTVYINRHPVQTLSPESHLLYLALHGSKHIYERLIWIVDIDRFVRTYSDLDWSYILKMAKNMGAEKMLLFSLALSRTYFHTPVPDFLIKETDPENFTALISFVNDEFNRKNPTPEDSLTKLRKIIALRDTLYYKVLTVVEFVFRPGINERRMVILSDRWFWLYWLLRPLGMGYRFLFCRLLKLCAEPHTSA